MLNTVWHNPSCTCRSWSLLCCSVSLLLEAPHLAGIGCNLLLQAQVAVQQRLGAGFVFAIVLAGQKGLPLPQPRVCFVDVSKVLNGHREENTWIHPGSIISSSFLFVKLRNSKATSRRCESYEWGNFKPVMYLTTQLIHRILVSKEIQRLPIYLLKNP